VKAERRLRRLELATFQRFLATTTRRDCDYYLRLLRHLIAHGPDSVSAEHRERAAALHLLVTGELLCN
jgi:hypothetical protein